MHFTHRVSCCCRACRILSAVKVLVASPELQVNVLHQEVQQVIRRCEVDSRLQLFNGGFDYCLVVRLVRLERPNQTRRATRAPVDRGINAAGKTLSTYVLSYTAAGMVHHLLLNINMFNVVALLPGSISSHLSGPTTYLSL